MYSILSLAAFAASTSAAAWRPAPIHANNINVASHDWHHDASHPRPAPQPDAPSWSSSSTPSQSAWSNTSSTPSIAIATSAPSPPSPSIVSLDLTTTELVLATVDVTVTACSPGSCQPTSAVPEAPSQPASSSTAPAPPAQSPPAHSPPASSAAPKTPLTNKQQVGDSLSGTLEQPFFPKWLPDGNGKPYAAAPWGNRNTKEHDATNPADIPVTGVTRYYNFTISRGQISADGVLRDVMLVNNQFPGPAIEANWGDMIEVSVQNDIAYPFEGTSIHWHGFLQRGSNWYDGVPSVSQCPIAPGKSFTYHIPAQLYGSSWYHAHYSAQYTAGIVGPIVIYGPSQTSYDVDVGPVMLSDWYHAPYFSIVSDAVGTDLSEIPPASDSLLINGRGRFTCSNPSYGNETEWLASNVSADLPFTCVDDAPLSKFKFLPGKVHRLRLMNIGADGIQKFSIDGHSMTVIAYDYVPTVPYSTEVVTLGVGQRADVLVTADNKSGNMFWMRSAAPGGPTCGGSKIGEVQAAIYYEGANTEGVPTTTSSVNDASCLNAALGATQPEYSITPSANPWHQDMTLSLELNATGHYEWRMNNQTFRANFNEPSLMLAAAGNTSYPDDPQWNVYNFGSNSSVVINVTNETPFAHPFHLHGHNFYVLNVGLNQTVWDGSTINPTNPMRRDVQIVPPGGYAAIAFESDNPGVWPFHCHVAWHLSGGLAMNVMTHPESIPAIPEGMREQTCTDWDHYSNTNVVDQIDAGS